VSTTKTIDASTQRWNEQISDLDFKKVNELSLKILQKCKKLLIFYRPGSSVGRALDF
jgi:hypothetical protein